MRVLLVAPRNDLALVNDEVENIQRSGLDVTALTRSKVNSDDLLREIRDGDYDVLWLSTHGGEYVRSTGELLRDLKVVSPAPPTSQTDYGVQLSDGMLSMSELTAMVRGRFKLVVLNTCDSLQIAQQLQVEANVSVVCTIAAVADRQAFQTGSIFASHLYDTGNISEAYRLSIPGGNRIYLYLAALSPSVETIDTLVAKIDKLTEKVESDTAASATTIKLLWRVIYILAALHVPEWIALFLLWRS